MFRENKKIILHTVVDMAEIVKLSFNWFRITKMHSGRDRFYVHILEGFPCSSSFF